MPKKSSILIDVLIFHTDQYYFGFDITTLESIKDSEELIETDEQSGMLFGTTFHPVKVIDFEPLFQIHNPSKRRIQKILLIEQNDRYLGLKINNPDGIFQQTLDDLDRVPPVLKTCMPAAVWAVCLYKRRIALLLDIHKLLADIPNEIAA